MYLFGATEEISSDYEDAMGADIIKIIGYRPLTPRL